MSLDLAYSEKETVIRETYLSMLPDLVFRSHFLFDRLYKKKKTFNGRKIVHGVEYGENSNVQFMSEWGTYTLTPEDILTAAAFEPKMLNGSLIISDIEAITNTGKDAIHDIVKLKLENTRKSLIKKLATQMWTRTAVGTNDWNSVTSLVGVAACGGIPASSTVPTWWKSKVIAPNTDTTLGGGVKGGDATSEADLMDSQSGVYLKRLYQTGIRRCRLLNGEDPTVIVVPPYIWDMTETMLDPQKTGSKLDETAATMGFSVLNYRPGIQILADQDLVDAQTGDTDGRMYFLNDNYFYLYINSQADFTASPFRPIPGMNAREMKLQTYGNVTISNRAVQAVITDIYSPKES